MAQKQRSVCVAGDQLGSSRTHYQALKDARNVLVNAFAIEEKYEILISNYLDFEREILSATAADMVRDHADYFDFFEVRLGLNIRLVNLLTSARLYLDQLNRHVRECLPQHADTKDTIKSLLSAEYDRHIEYRFMEALRNHVQHYGLPVHWASSGSRWTSLEADGLMEYSMELAAEKERLAEDGIFKKEVLAQLPGRIDLKAAARRYLESFSNVQDAARTLIQESLEGPRRTVEDAHTEYGELYKEGLAGLSASKWEDQQCLETVPLLLDWDDICIKLQRRNRSLVNLRKRYVTSRADIKP